jgi:hypothetical protein
MADKKIFTVVDGPIGVRAEPDGVRTGAQLNQGYTFETFDELVDKGGYLWAKHFKGWSAVQTSEGDEVFMLDITNRSPDMPRIFRVIAQNISVRITPNGQRGKEKLFRKQEIRVNPASRTEAGGYIWWQHDRGWSAERSLDGNEIFMREVFDIPAATGGLATPKRVELPETWRGKMVLQVAKATKVRDKPSTDPRGMILINLKPGKVVEVDMATVTEADGYFWVRHELGWSAIRSIDGKTAFLAEPGSIPGMVYIGADGPRPTDLPGYRSLLKQMPVTMSDIQWVQYFGNNMYAYVYGKKYGYDRYSQGLHGGIDLGNSQRAGIKVYAGVEAQFFKTEYPSVNNTRVILKNGPYQFIYQHITNARYFTPGQQITPDTVLADIEHKSINNGWDHLHFEVRYMDEWIINPLLLMPEGMYTAFVERFKPDKPNIDYRKTESELQFFYKTPTWTKWTTPLDQPVLKLKGPCIGPRFEAGQEVI